MEPLKVVAHYTNGKVMKGFTQDFFPNKDHFHIFPATIRTDKGIEVLIKNLKAVFFVRDFIGDPQYNEQKTFLEGIVVHGRKVEVTCKDEELLVGSTLGNDPSRKGFFLFPADPNSNNMRIFIVSSAVKNFRYL